MPSASVTFSVLIPSIPSRIGRFLCPLLSKLEAQAHGQPVEIISLLDNKKRSIGLKRDALVQAARGEYLAFVDDDDDVSDDYISSILNAIHTNPNIDIITFNQKAIINGGNPFTIRFGIENSNEQAWKNLNGFWQDIVRKPFPICVWKSKIAKEHRFPDASYGEDWHWAERVLICVKTQTRIEKTLYTYRYDDRVTEANLDFA